MADTVKVKMLRTVNDGEFNPGDTRELSREDAERLAATGVVEILGAKAEAAPQNKKEAAPANKAARTSGTKKGK